MDDRFADFREVASFCGVINGWQSILGFFAVREHARIMHTGRVLFPSGRGATESSKCRRPGGTALARDR